MDELAADLRGCWSFGRYRRGVAYLHAPGYLRRYWRFGARGGTPSGGLGPSERRIANAGSPMRLLASKLFDIDVQVAQLPGGSKTRQLIVDTALEYLKRVASDARMESDLSLELGTAYMHVARVQGVNISTNLGQTVQAEQTEQKAQSLIDSVLAAEPGNRTALLRAGQIAHDRMILADNNGGSTEDVLRFAATSAERLNRFLDTRPLNASSDHMDGQQVVIALMNAANQYKKAGRHDDAIRIAGRAIEIANATNWPAQAGAAMMIVASSQRARGQLDEALRSVRESVRLLEPPEGEARPGRLQPYGLALIREGEILGEDQGINLNRSEEALACMERALKIGEDFARRDPSDYQSQYRVFFAETRIAAILRHTDPARASQYYEDALQRLAMTSANGSTLRNETETLAASVYPLLRLGRMAEARRRLDGV